MMGTGFIELNLANVALETGIMRTKCRQKLFRS